jgi:CRISPR system Cascade subunit CasE
MTYLSRLLLDTRHRSIQRDLANCYQLHRTIMRAFPQAESNVRDSLGVLYRLEEFTPDARLLRLLVQSEVAPDWSFLPFAALGADPEGRPNPAVRALDGEYQQIAVGMHFRFRLRANPTKRISNRNSSRDDKLQGKRVALLKEEDQLHWLNRKGEQHGFRLLASAVAAEVPEAHAAPQGIQRGYRPQLPGGEAMKLTFGAVRFDGRLEVTNPSAFIQALQAGIGSGKAFGFGLLSIASA